MDYSALIVTYNQKRALKRAIDSVLRQTMVPNEFIVIDNNSTDGTTEFLIGYKKKYPFFKILKSKINLGTCRGINIGVKLAKYSIIFNMDHDSELEQENWIEMAFVKLQNKRIALVWGRSNKGNFPKITYGSFIGSAILFKRDVFLSVGGFPEDFFIYDNELDLTVRYYIVGYYPYFNKDLDVKHGLPAEEQSTSGMKGKTYIYYDLSNRLFIYWKYYPFYIATVLSLFHFFRVMTNYTRYFREYFEPFRGLMRFFNKFYLNVCREKNTLGLKQFLKICFQQQFPSLIYYFLKKIYNKKFL